MCCSRRNRGTPAVLVLDRTAPGNYEEHKAEKRLMGQRSSPDLNHSTLSHETFPEQANNEVLDKAGISPPSYNELVANRAIVPPEPNSVVDNKKGWVGVAGEEKLEHDDVSDAGSFYTVSDGVRAPSAQSEAHQLSFVEKWEAARAEKKKMRCEQGKTACQSKCEQKKAERLARRAGRKARCGGCC